MDRVNGSPHANRTHISGFVDLRLIRIPDGAKARSRTGLSDLQDLRIAVNASKANMELMERIELFVSSLPKRSSAIELHQHGAMRQNRTGFSGVRILRVTFYACTAFWCGVRDSNPRLQHGKLKSWPLDEPSTNMERGVGIKPT